MRIHAIPDDPVNDAAWARANLPRPAFYVLRPDGHVGLCGARVDVGQISRYVAERLRIAT